MKKISKIVCTLTVALFLTAFNACGDSDPKIDGSSEEAMEKSVQVIMDGLSDERKEEFMGTLAGIYILGGLDRSGSNKSDEEIQAEITAELDGKTADDIFAMAAEMEKR